MRKIEIEVFKFDELNDKAKEKARAWYREGDSYPWADENREALEAFCEHFGCSARDWSYSSYDSSISVGNMPENAEDIKGLRLYAWLGHNHFDYLFPWKFIGFKPSPIEKGKNVTYLRKYSKVHRAHACPTGYYASESMLDPIYRFLESPTKDKTLRDLLKDCMEEWVDACQKDSEYYSSDESVDENITINEYEFTADGSFYRG